MSDVEQDSDPDESSDDVDALVAALRLAEQTKKAKAAAKRRSKIKKSSKKKSAADAESPAETGPEKIKADWNEVRTKILINFCLEETNRGEGTSTGYKTPAWRRILRNFIVATGCNYQLAQIQSAHAQLKKKYQVMSSLRRESGFGWDEQQLTVTAPDTVWTAYLAVKAHKDAAQFRHAGLANYSELEQIFCGRVATGQFANSSTNPKVGVDRSDGIDDHDGDKGDGGYEDDDSEDEVAIIPVATMSATLNSTPATKVGPEKVKRGTASLLNKDPPRKKHKNQEVIDEMKLMRLTISAPSKLSEAIALFNKAISEMDTPLTTQQKLKCKMALQVAKNAELFLNLDDTERQEYIQVMLDE